MPYVETAQSERFYGRVARKYNRLFERAILSESRLTELAREALDGRRVLDLACGNARWLERIAPASYVGLDLSAPMLAEGRRDWPGAALVRADMTRLPFGDGAFDGLMTMFGAMGHLPPDGQRRLIEESWRVLAPGGWAVFTNGNMWSPFNLPTTLRGNRVRLEGVRFRVHSSNPRRFAQLLERFEIVTLESYDYSYLPIVPVQLTACLLGRDYRAWYGGLMAVLDHCRDVPTLRWFGKQLLAVCRKR